MSQFVGWPSSCGPKSAKFSPARTIAQTVGPAATSGALSQPTLRNQRTCELRRGRVDRLSPDSQIGILGMRDAQIVDIVQQMDPAALVGADMNVVGAVAITNQRAPIVRAQDCLDHRSGSAPVIVEVAHPRGTDGPVPAIAPFLPPARLVGMDHWTAPDLGSQLRQHRLGPLVHRPQQADQGAQPQMQPMDRLQQPLDRPERQPTDGVKAGDGGDGLGADPVLSDHLVAEMQRGGDGLFSAGTDPTANDMLDDLGRDPRGVEHLASDPLAPSERGVAAGTVRDPMLDELGGHIPAADKLLGPRFPGLGRFVGPGWPDEGGTLGELGGGVWGGSPVKAWTWAVRGATWACRARIRVIKASRSSSSSTWRSSSIA